MCLHLNSILFTLIKEALLRRRYVWRPVVHPIQNIPEEHCLPLSAALMTNIIQISRWSRGYRCKICPHNRADKHAYTQASGRVLRDPHSSWFIDRKLPAIRVSLTISRSATANLSQDCSLLWPACLPYGFPCGLHSPLRLPCFYPSAYASLTSPFLLPVLPIPPPFLLTLCFYIPMS